jgi:hypothetical protein
MGTLSADFNMLQVYMFEIFFFNLHADCFCVENGVLVAVKS